MLPEAADHVRGAGGVSRRAPHIQEQPHHQGGALLHPLRQGLKDPLPLVHGVARHQHRPLSLREQFPDDHTGVAIRGGPRFGTRGDHIDHRLLDTALCPIRQQQVEQRRDLGGGEALPDQRVQGLGQGVGLGRRHHPLDGEARKRRHEPPGPQGRGQPPHVVVGELEQWPPS